MFICGGNKAANQSGAIMTKSELITENKKLRKKLKESKEGYKVLMIIYRNAKKEIKMYEQQYGKLF